MEPNTDYGDGFSVQAAALADDIGGTDNSLFLENVHDFNGSGAVPVGDVVEPTDNIFVTSAGLPVASPYRVM